MNIQRFQAPTAREALALARLAFGDGALILANRQLPSGDVEVTATSEEALGQLESHGASAPAPAPRAAAPRPSAPVAAMPAPAAESTVGADTEQLAMSTLSFQDYVRERMARRQQAEQEQVAPPLRAAPVLPPQPAAAPALPVAPATARVAEMPWQPEPPAQVAQLEQVAPPAAPMPQMAEVMAELQAMKQLMEERFTTLSWMGQARQEPVRSTLLLKLIRAGFSPALSRTVLERVNTELSPAESVRDVMATLARMLAVPAGPGIEETGGIFAFVGATGVGKTTAIARLATLCARAHGAQSVGLITLDTHRAGAHEQLRAFGRSINVVAHLAHDRAALLEMLALFARKKLVLVDTSGVAPRDARLADHLAMIELPQLQRVLVLNAGTHGDTLDDMAGAFRARQAVISKTDEAVKLGPVLDTVIRHRLGLRGVSCGQRVPEDWLAPDAAQLVRDAMRAIVRSAFEPRNNADMDFFLSPSECSMAE
ncbi:flagellar biosynthesis protein FlhF [Xenophilus arseniciresistens]|uniref:Flagellar biosynthesis protein FlhF n=1 Tax=Xenophilus arseniciresistens TaxID=1283306 RepID=A0AAE3N3T5_9BURK|nr:flagellar biosynthesis protein FlhF [Xenophilus arseniciresistens]MDA7415245.1 flagellar biosynthesis protein FlhF [Xenophilus arseniciresistens]